MVDLPPVSHAIVFGEAVAPALLAVVPIKYFRHRSVVNTHSPPDVDV
jgi:hypothetical protein